MLLYIYVAVSVLCKCCYIYCCIDIVKILYICCIENGISGYNRVQGGLNKKEKNKRSPLARSQHHHGEDQRSKIKIPDSNINIKIITENIKDQDITSNIKDQGYH